MAGGREGAPGSGGAPDSAGAAGLALLAVIAGTYLRCAGALEAPLFGDEYHAVRTAGEGLASVLTTFDQLGSHVALPLLQWLCSQAFDHGLLATRLPALIPGVLTLALLYPVARNFVGRGPAALCTLALALAPMHVYYSRFGRSYALSVFLGLLLLGALGARSGRRSLGRDVGLVLLVGLLPYVHLASAGYVLALALAALAVPGSEGSVVQRRTLALFGAGVLLSVALYLPVREPLWEYLTTRGTGAGATPRDHPTSLLGVPLLLGGGAWGLGALLLGVPLGLAQLRRQELHGNRSAALLAAALLGPLVFLLATRPHGMEYAWSRYLLLALPAAWMLTALAWTRVAGRLALPLGSLLLIGGALLGPSLGSVSAVGAPFTNTYVALRELPAFDAPDPGASQLYAQLAEDPSVERIAEAPDLYTRALLLYRNRQLAHGKQVLLGLGTSREDMRLNAGPHVLLSRKALLGAGVDVLVLHKDLAGELERYWRFVYEDAWPGLRTLGDAGFMARHSTYFMPPGDSAAFATSLRSVMDNRLGAPFFEDEALVAWRVE